MGTYGKTLPFTGAAFGAMGYWGPVLVALGLISFGALALRISRPIKNRKHGR